MRGINLHHAQKRGFDLDVTTHSILILNLFLQKVFNIHSPHFFKHKLIVGKNNAKYSKQIYPL